jgi:hypothetical protein
MQRVERFGIQRLATDSEIYGMQVAINARDMSPASPLLCHLQSDGVCSARTMRSQSKVDQ